MCSRGSPATACASSPRKGSTGDISDVWANFADFSDSFKAASTGNDGKQYLVPTSYYPWAVHYRKSVFDEKGYTDPDDEGRDGRVVHEDAEPTG